MIVSELIKQLEQYPSDSPVDAMFPDGTDAYPVTGTELFTLAQGSNVVVIDISVGPHLASA
jgi:hypothetical protein